MSFVQPRALAISNIACQTESMAAGLNFPSGPEDESRSMFLGSCMGRMPGTPLTVLPASKSFR